MLVPLMPMLCPPRKYAVAECASPTIAKAPCDPLQWCSRQECHSVVETKGDTASCMREVGRGGRVGQ